MTDRPLNPSPSRDEDPAAVERTAITTTGVIGAVLGWGAGVAVYFLLRRASFAVSVPWQAWLAFASVLSLAWGWLFARVMRRHFERRRRLATKLAELMAKLGAATSGEARDKLEAAINKIEDDETRAFLLAHFQGKKTTSA